MIGSLNAKERKVTIVGAGISGLLMANELDKRGFEVTLIEKGSRPGGLIRTLETEWGPVETAAHSLLVTQEVRKFCDELDVELAAVRPESRARNILRKGKMRKFPLNPWEAVKALNRAYFVLSTPELSRGGATVEHWAKHHLGEAALDYLLAPYLNGIYAARPSEIAISAAFPGLEIPQGHSLLSYRLHQFRKRMMGQNSRKGPKAFMAAPKDGMESLVKALKQKLERRLGNRFKMNSQADQLPEGSNVILTVPTIAAATLLQDKDSILASELKQVKYSPLITATIFAPRDLFKNPPKGIGVLIPESENRKCLGVLFTSSSFPGRVRDEAQWLALTMMLGGTSRPEMIDLPEAKLKETIRDELTALFQINAKDGRIQILITRWPNAIPQYNSQLMTVWETARKGWCSEPGHILFGNYTGQVSIRGMMQSVDALGMNLAAGLQVQG